MFLDIPSPPVPSSVTSASTVKEQIEEMKKWLTAFQHNDQSKDLHKHFTPILSYVEGAWEAVDDNDVVKRDDEKVKIIS